MELDDPFGDDEPNSRLLPPDDRLWRHPSEVGATGGTKAHPRWSGGATRVWTVAILAGLAGATFALGLTAATGNLRRILRVPVLERVVLPANSLAPDATVSSPEVKKIGRRVRQAVVGIEVEIEGIDRHVGGAGIVFRSDGHVLTNNHVVEGATRIVVVMADGHRHEGRLVGADEGSDLAVVKVNEDVTVPVATMGTAASLEVGQKVMMLGGPPRPGAVDEPDVEVALVGALGREIERDTGPALLDMIQTDTPVAPTWSGGALVDGTGAVVGITTTLSATDGGRSSRAGFATPIDWAREVAEQLLATGTVMQVWVGVEGGDLDAGTARTMGVSGGAVVTQVRDGSPAGSAGLQAEDVITAVDDEPVHSMAGLRLALRTHKPGDTVTMAIVRGQEAQAVEVQLAERPAQS